MKRMLCYVCLAATFIVILSSAYMSANGLICKKDVEIFPGLRWEYYSDNYSRLISDKFGVIAKGKFQLLFCDYGLYVCASETEASRYIDMYEQRIEEISKAGTNLWSKVGTIFSTDAQTAMGVYDVNGMVLFRQELDSLKERIRQKDRPVTK